MNMMNKRFAGACFRSGIAALVLALSSCASGPRLIDAEGEFAYLPAGGRAYFYADVALARPILSSISLEGIDMNQTGRFLDKVDFLAGAVYPRGAPQHLQLHAWKRKGRVPGAGALFLSAGWKKTESPTGNRYYHSEGYGLSIATQGSHAFVSDADPFAFDPAAAPPNGLAELRWEAVVMGWLDNAGAPVNNFLSAIGMPVRVPTDRILFGVYHAQEPEPDTVAAGVVADEADPADEVDAADLEDTADLENAASPADRANNRPGAPLYELRLRVETQNANQARALATLLAFVRVFVESPDIAVEAEYLEALRPLLANPPSQDGPDLLIRTGSMDAAGIALLFNRFGVYSH
jgi:hypothetical protein